VMNPEQRSCGIASALLDGEPVDADAVPLVDDGAEHEVTIVLGTPRPAESQRTIASASW
jgi:hypothetical protein